METKIEVVDKNVQMVVKFNPFRQMLEKFCAKENELTFDYQSEKGRKEAKEHCKILRQSKSIVEETRVSEKAESLNYGRAIDREANAIISRFDELISKHMDVIKEIEEKEKQRIEKIQAFIKKIDDAPFLKNENGENLNSEEIKALLIKITDIEINDELGELKDNAQKAKDASQFRLEKMLASTKKLEAEKAELELLRKQKEAQDKKDYEEKLRKEGEEKAQRDAELRLENERIEAEKRENALHVEAEKREVARIAAEKKAKEDHEKQIQEAKIAHERALLKEQGRLENEKIVYKQKLDREEKAREAARIEQENKEIQKREAAKKESERLALIEQKRVENKKHREKIEREASVALFEQSEGQFTIEDVNMIIDLIIEGKIKNVTINY